MSPRVSATTKKSRPPARLPELPDPPERHEAELTGRPNEKLLGPPHRSTPMLLALLIIVLALTILIALLR